MSRTNQSKSSCFRVSVTSGTPDRNPGSQAKYFRRRVFPVADFSRQPRIFSKVYKRKNALARLGLVHWFCSPHFLPCETRSHDASLLEPTLGGWRSPERLPLRIVQLPLYRLPVRIGAQVISGVELDSVAVGVSKVEKESIRDSMPPGAPLDRGQVTARSCNLSAASRMLCLSLTKSPV